MPWNPQDAKKHDKKAATSAVASRQWAHVANSELKRTGDEGLAVRAANGVIKRRVSGGKKGKPPGKQGNRIKHSYKKGLI